VHVGVVGILVPKEIEEPRSVESGPDERHQHGSPDQERAPMLVTPGLRSLGALFPGHFRGALFRRGCDDSGVFHGCSVGVRGFSLYVSAPAASENLASAKSRSHRSILDDPARGLREVNDRIERR
jgi:hypothetical protein